jgi:predicted O-linked N-acetylglucosamine transferase (SPINDLY family)
MESTLPLQVSQALQRATALHEQGRLEEAEQAYANILTLEPSHFVALHRLAVLALQQGRHEDALRRVEAALRVNPGAEHALMNKGTILFGLGRHNDALVTYNQVLLRNPNEPDAYFNIGNVLMAAGRPAEAATSFARVVSLRTGDVQAQLREAGALALTGRTEEAVAKLDRAIEYGTDVRPLLLLRHERARLLIALHRYDDAVATYDIILAQNANDTDALNNRGNVLLNLKRLDEALVSYDRAIAIKSDFALAVNNRGNVLRYLKRFEEALASYDRAIMLQPDSAMLFYNRGNALLDLKRLDEALTSYDRAIALKPDYAEAFNNRGNTLFELKRLLESLASCDRAIALKPDYAEAFNNRGNALFGLKRLDEALANYDKAIGIRPDFAGALNNRGNALFELKRFDEALASYDKAIAISPDFAAALNNRGSALLELKRLDEALASYDKAIAIRPDYFDALVGSMRLLDQMCLWSESGSTRDDLVAKCRSPAFDGAPFWFMSMRDDPPLHRAVAEAYVRNKTPLSQPPMWRQRRARAKIRIGYLSPNFRHHAEFYLIGEVIELHDRSSFEIVGFSTGRNDGSDQRRRLETAFDAFVDVSAMADTALAHRIAEAEIDILVDLGGHTQDGRILALVHRPAPVQATYLGYPGTSGASFIDYAIVDAHVVPPSEAPNYSEKLVYLPECYQCNNRRRRIAERTPSRIEYGLPADGFVFCCFNNSYKLNAPIFDVWMWLLRAVPGSVLWLLADNVWAPANLRQEAAARGVAPQRIVFAERVDNPEHLARHRLADLFIDTSPCNAHTTASDALWAGLPVLTYTGRSFAGRVAGSLLRAIGLPELVACSLSEYKALALRLATHPSELHTLRDRLACNRTTHPLFDSARWTRHLEAAYQKMWHLHCNGDPPRSFAPKS